MPGAKSFLKRQIAGHIHRGTRAISLLLEMSPVLLSFSMFIRHIDASSDSRWPGSIESDIWSDGQAIYYSEAFELRSARTQVSLVAKHLLKTALCHSARARRMRSALGAEFDARLFVLASDLVTNQSISRSASVGRYYEELHPTLDSVLKAHAAWRKTECAYVPAHEWSVEQVYSLLTRWRDSIASLRTAGSTDDAIESLLRCVVMNMEWEAEEIQLGHETVRNQDIAALQQWSTRLIQAKAGDRPGGLLRSIGGDLPQVKTPWNHLLRSATLRAIAKRPSDDWSRPSRRMVSRMVHPAFRGPLSFEPARQSAIAAPKIAVLVDTSGSISNDVLKIFAATMSAIQRAKKTQLRVVVGDAAVNEVVDIEPDQFARVIHAIKFKGGGGTDFRPLIAEATHWSPDVIVYLTDLAGTFPAQAPKCTMIWAVVPMPGMYVGLQAPFGNVIVLE